MDIDKVLLEAQPYIGVWRGPILVASRFYFFSYISAGIMVTKENSDFLITLSLQPNVVDLIYFKL